MLDLVIERPIKKVQDDVRQERNDDDQTIVHYLQQVLQNLQTMQTKQEDIYRMQQETLDGLRETIEKQQRRDDDQRMVYGMQQDIVEEQPVPSASLVPLDPPKDRDSTAGCIKRKREEGRRKRDEKENVEQFEEKRTCKRVKKVQF